MCVCVCVCVMQSVNVYASVHVCMLSFHVSYIAQTENLTCMVVKVLWSSLNCMYVKVAPLLSSSVTADPLMIVVLAIVLMAVAAILTFNRSCCSTSSAQFI